ncbi:MAG: putative zinc-binding protein [Methanospirillaceae archaeon]|nr:putative zinc-binding protein [Methanospirillaceae archaeon]
MYKDSDIVLVTCSGISNTGKLTAKMGETLARRYPGLIECFVPARTEPGKFCFALMNAGKIAVVDGCSDCCGRKRVREHGFEPVIHIVATECGIVKNGMEEPRFDEIELLISVVCEKLI